MTADDYTPTTERVRADYVRDHTRGYDEYQGDYTLTAVQEFYGAQFDAWLAAHDRQVRAQALRAAADELERLDDNPLIRPLVANSQGATAMHEYALATIRDRADAEERGE